MLWPAVGPATGIGGNDAYTTLLLHCDGADGLTTFTDSSASANTVTANGNAQIDTAQSKFGGASALFDGNGDYLRLGSSSDLTLSADFTIDGWIRFNVVGNDTWIASSGGGFTIQLNTSNQVLVWNGSNHASSTVPSTGTWYHYALVRSGGSLVLYWNGSPIISYSDSSTTRYDLSSGYVGQNNTSSGTSLNGWMDEIRVSKGIARWTASFTPPTSAYS